MVAVDVDVLYSHQKEIHYLFELQNKLEAPLICAVPSDPIPHASCLYAKNRNSYANVIK